MTLTFDLQKISKSVLSNVILDVPTKLEQIHTMQSLDIALTNIRKYGRTDNPKT